MVRFEDLGIDGRLSEVLKGQGLDVPFPIQAATIPDALSGRDVCGKAKTGSGKTLAFSLPVVQRTLSSHPGTPRALVLVPTRELASQVLEVVEPFAAAAGRKAIAVYGGTPLEKQIKTLADGVDVVVATPGRLIDLLERGAVDLGAIEICVLDEADRMADMGFLPQVEWVLRRLPDSRQLLLFSATLDSEVNALVRHYLKDPVVHAVDEQQVTVEEMHHAFLAVHEMDRVKVVASISKGVERVIVFCRTKRGADRLVSELKKEGVRAEAMHGDLRQQARERSLRNFVAGKAVLVATDVAARGIHVDDVDVVIQFDPAEDHKTYLHRAGRTARAGSTGVVVTFVLWNQENEVERLKRRLQLDVPTIEVFSNNPGLLDIRTMSAATAKAS
ncbi:MAG TPA: DEAD/DEAH box helicase [Acidimicrobiales bacterium]|nr:DEAD/DEAH box helicase [Acidimicrobiales bacterium]